MQNHATQLPAKESQEGAVAEVALSQQMTDDAASECGIRADALTFKTHYDGEFHSVLTMSTRTTNGLFATFESTDSGISEIWPNL